MRDNWNLEIDNDKIPYKANTLTDPATIVLADIAEFNTLIITTTTAPAGVFTLPLLTANTEAGQFLTVVNNDTSTDSIELNGQEIKTGTSFRLEWD